MSLSSQVGAGFTRVGQAIKAIKGQTVGVVLHDGSTAGGIRPSGYAYVVWKGGTTRPTNMISGDIWEHEV